jgi:hypothetical protein
MSEPVVRISKGKFDPKNHDEIYRLSAEAAKTLVPAITKLRRLIYYHAGVDALTNTFVHVSVWTDLAAAEQMGSLPAMLAQIPILEKAGVHFDQRANYAPLWKIEGVEKLF